MTIGTRSLRQLAAITIALVLMSVGLVHADVQSREKSQLQFGGTLGRVVNLFGGKAAREGVESTVAVKGSRKATSSGETAKIIDLAEQKIYDLDLRHKTYTVTTFAALRQQMEEDEQRAEKEAKEHTGEASPSEKPEKEYQVDFDTKATGQTRSVNGFSTREVVATVTVHEKGRTLDQSGGLVLTDDMWLAPTVAAMKEVTDFDVRYATALAGPYAPQMSGRQMASAIAMYPGFADAFKKLNTENVNVTGTPIVSDVKVDAVKSPEEIAEAKKADEDDQPSASGGLGGLFGGLSKKLLKKKTESQDADQARSTVMTIHHEVLQIDTAVSADAVSIPAGFRLKQ